VKQGRRRAEGAVELMSECGESVNQGRRCAGEVVWSMSENEAGAGAVTIDRTDRWLVIE
jgi:hypothetical protein